MPRLILTLSLIFLANTAIAAHAFKTGRIELKSALQSQILVVQFASDPDQLRQGLMFRKTLSPYSGMLFDFQENKPIIMWMKNTLIPLDMVFFDADKQVIHIEKNTTPHSEAQIISPKPARYVLELEAGMADYFQIHIGNTFSYVAQ